MYPTRVALLVIYLIFRFYIGMMQKMFYRCEIK